jgi:two-component system aerobic respiration control sensor histidine kinase ArcB
VAYTHKDKDLDCMTSGNNAEIDWVLLEQYRDILGAEGIQESIRMFLQMAPEYFAELTGFYTQQNEAKLRRQAHKLKGSCHSLGFKRLGESMQLIEKEDWQWQDVGHELEQWPHCFAADTTIVNEWLVQQGS